MDNCENTNIEMVNCIPKSITCISCELSFCKIGVGLWKETGEAIFLRSLKMLNRFDSSIILNSNRAVGKKLIFELNF